ncbi:Phosphatidylinositol 4-kinase PIK1 [Purpureocillium lavendulum]|uniref:Phosphatidylinositol 4-kinase PIK1 n=1 Tax=Purpureocillium lavendulum TaxID=1247861 RepID=A0AB34FZE1_9HYPO|nr:Phosphatidylinositol 4-kinase PIK1 [Purpureocillium lavendulum]
MAEKLKTFDITRLPPELRAIIWEHAAEARPDPAIQPGAQYFTIYDLRADGECAIKDKLNKHGRFGYGLAGPSTALQPRAGDMSAYHIYRGLSAACWAARRALTRHIRASCFRSNYKPCDPSYLWAPADTEEARRAQRGFTVECRFSEPREDGWRRFQVSPMLDLMIIQPFDYDHFDMTRLCDLWQNTFGLPQWMGDYSCQNLALEINPGWFREGRQAHKSAFKTLERAARYGTADRFNNIWLVDYSIRRTPGTGTEIRSDRKVFTGNRCRFVEVQLRDAQWDFYTVLDSYNFVRKLNFPGHEWPLQTEGPAPAPLCHLAPFCQQRTWGILACELEEE